ncbi:MFS transporter [Longimicrobium sp.]|uniref:MFS transporter n=1 Tax=Longimicrobium sp. TaxID=2029185 RepID=UPI003B3BBACA
MSDNPAAPAREPVTRVLAEMRSFSVIWLGQLVSSLGSGLTGFALPVWIYQKTGSAEAFGLLFFAATVPAVLLSPFAGALVDRWDRRRVLLVSDALAALMTLAIGVLLYTGAFQVWHLVVMSGLSSAVGTFQNPAFTASMGMLVPGKHFSRAAGMMQTSDAITGILTPLVAGVLVTSIGLWGILAIDVITFLIAVATLAAVRIPNPPPSPRPRQHLLREAHDGWVFVRQRPGLLALLIYFPLINLGQGMVNPLFGPMVLSFANPAQLGAVVSVSSVGLLVGSLALSAWGGPAGKVRGLLLAQSLCSLLLIGVALRPSVVPVTVFMFLMLLVSPLAGSSSQAIWLSKTPRHMMGRVFAIRRMLAMSTMPVAALACGPLAERVFNPLMMPGGVLEHSAGRVLGVGPGRGIALLFVLVGAFVIVATALLYLSPRVRRLEDEIPDAVAARPAAPEPAPASGPRPAAAGA